VSLSNLEALFEPRSVALFGASARPATVGAVTLRNLLDGGFAGELLLVNPHAGTLAGRPVYPDVAALPFAPDLALIATPPDTVAAIVAALGARGTKAAIVITAGFGELGEHGRALQHDMLAAARAHDLRIVGPNCIGVLAPAAGLNASFAQVAPPPGEIAFLSQSGAMVTAMLDWAQPRGIGFSKIVSLGDMADVDFGDLLELLERDPATRAIALYIEGIDEAAKFMRAARAAARSKPVLVLKVGRQAAGAKAARSHTGALAGSDVVYDAAFRRAGMLRVETMAEIFDGFETLALTRPVSGERLAIVTNGGGPGVIATDALIAAGGALAELAPPTIAKLDALLPPTWSHGNPVDMIGDAPPQHYAGVLAALFDDGGADAVLVLNCPTALSNPVDAARAVIGAVRAAKGGKNVLTSWLGEQLAGPARELFEAAGIATYATPDEAVQGFMHRVRFHRSQALLAHEPAPAAAFTPDRERVHAILAQAAAAGRTWLDAADVGAVLAAYGIPALRSRSVADPAAAAQAAAELGGPVALKLRSPDLTHKSDVGGVALNLAGPERVRREAAAMLERIAASNPQARVDGFLVQEMARPGALELIVGVSVDEVFGPVVLFGHGGTAVEYIADTALELPPLDLELARAQMARTRVWRLLQGYRSTPAADLGAIAEVLVRVGRLAIDHPTLAELDVNPLLADAQGVVAVDARIGVSDGPGPPAALAQ